MGEGFGTERRRSLSSGRRSWRSAHVAALDERLPPGRRSLRRAAWAGLQDSMPRAALLSIHARVEGTEPTAWEDPSLIQLWGPRHRRTSWRRATSRSSRSDCCRTKPAPGGEAEDLATRLHALLDGARMTYGEAGRALGVDPNALRYAAPTGTVVIRWEGARQPTIWTVPAPEVDPRDARLELARRYLHVFGPTAPESFARWAGIAPRRGVQAFDALRKGADPGADTDRRRMDPHPRRARIPRRRREPVAPARLLPSGDAYFLLQGDDRELLVPDADQRRELWTPRVWPGALVVGGEVVGTWRRAGRAVTARPWRRLSRAARDAVEAEAGSLPLPGVEGRIAVGWGE